MSGVKNDVIATLLLNPGCQECQSLIARVFPGKAAQELIHGADAKAVQKMLDLEMERIAKQFSNKSNTSSALDPIPPTASRHLAGIELKIVEENSKLEPEAAKLSTATNLRAVASPEEGSKSTVKKSSSRHSHSASSTAKSTKNVFDPSFIDRSRISGGKFIELGADENEREQEAVSDEEDGPCTCKLSTHVR